MLFLPALTGTEAQNLYFLTAGQQLQKNLSPVSEPHRVPELVGFSAHLGEHDGLYSSYPKLPLQVLGNVPQPQACTGRNAYGARSLARVEPMLPTAKFFLVRRNFRRRSQADGPRREAINDQLLALNGETSSCVPERARPLAQLVREKTGGNPFFAIQFFTALAEEGLLSFDSAALAWQWDIDRIRAKNYTDNVVDLMAGKLRRLSAPTEEALKQIACLGNVATIATLTLVHGTTEEAMHATLWEAVRAGLVLRLDDAYKFLHDRIQQAAYSLIPDEHRAEVHLHIGRMLLASMTADEFVEHLFDVASQFNRGAALLIDRDEKVHVATIDLSAGRKAKASAAYAPASAYFSAGMALLDEKDWASQYELTFRLWLERADCELLSGNFEKAEQLIVELLQRAASKVDQAAVYRLKVQFHLKKSESQQAVTSALTGLRLFGIDLPAHPTWEEVQAEYEAVWQTLNGRPIENLIDLPVMIDPELQAAMQVLSVLIPPAFCDSGAGTARRDLDDSAGHSPQRTCFGEAPRQRLKTSHLI
jgi:predicted ATPase